MLAELHTGNVLFNNESVHTMLAWQQSILGAFPRKWLTSGKHSPHYFDQQGAIYVNCSDTDAQQFDLLRPKSSSLVAALFLELPLSEHECDFVSFLESVLTPEPSKRPSAQMGIEHPFINHIL